MNLRVIGTITTSLLFTACGGSGGGTTSTPTPSPTPTPFTFNLDGGVQADLVFDGQVSFNDFGGFATREAIEEDGSFRVSVETNESVIAAETIGGSFLKVATGETFDVISPAYLSANTHVDDGVELALTPFSHWAACYTEYLLGGESPRNVPESEYAEAVIQANQTFEAIYGFPVHTTLPIDVTDASYSGTDVTDEVLAGYLIAGISQLGEDIVLAQGANPINDDYYSSAFHFAQIGCWDIRYDGLFNGVGQDEFGAIRDLFFVDNTTDEIDGTYYRDKIVEAAFRFINNSEFNLAGFDAATLSTRLISVFETGNDIFAGWVPEDFSLEGPQLSVDINDDDIIAGVFPLSVTVSDRNNIDDVSVTISIDGEEVASDSFLGEQIFNIDTASFSNTEHALVVAAVDAAGATFIDSYSVEIFNVAPTVTATSSTLVGSRDYTLSGTYSATAIAVASITVNGEAANFNNGDWDIALSLDTGFNDLTIVITDAIGNSSETEYRVAVDTSDPLLLYNLSRFRSSGVDNTTLNQCAFTDYLGATSGAFCLMPSRTSLGATPVSTNIGNDNYYFANLDMTDERDHGVFTEVSDLVVEYQYSRETGGLVVDWTLAPSNTNGSDIAIVPFTTEYLGADFYTFGFYEVHTVTIRVTDSVGNSAQRDFDFRITMVPDVD